MIIITPEQFRDSFQKIITNQTNSQKVLGQWYKQKDFTKMMRDEILPCVAPDIGLKCYSEKDYYWLDAIFYENNDTNHFGKDTIFANYIAVAIEHEHIDRGTAVEMNKLQLFNCPLKVLITYPGKDKKGLLDTYTEIIKSADIFSDISTLRKQLVIFGFKEDNEIIWEYHVYDGHNFSRI